MSHSELLNISDLSLKGRRVLIRCDLNVPVKESKILNNHRIMNSLPTIRYALDQGARVILTSHLGRPKKIDLKLSLAPVAQAMGEILDVDVFFVEDVLSDASQILSPSLRKNQLILLENLRFYPQELNNDETLARILAQNIDIYINDAFGVCHREHMSLCALPKYVQQKGVGFLIKKEMEFLDRIRKNPKPPFTVVLGGSKVKDKFSLITNLIDQADRFIIGGPMAYVFLKAKGCFLGDTPVETKALSLAKELIERMEARKKKLYLPVDHIEAPKIEKYREARATENTEVSNGWMALDIGPQTIQSFCSAIQGSRTIFWNGPVGMFEIKAYEKGTRALAENIGNHPEAFRVIGGGDSARAVHQYKLLDHFDHVSTGGGAALSYIQGKPLPGIENFKTSPRLEDAYLKEEIK